MKPNKHFKKLAILLLIVASSVAALNIAKLGASQISLDSPATLPSDI